MTDFSKLTDEQLAVLPEPQLLEALGLTEFAREHGFTTLQEVHDYAHYMEVAPKEIGFDLIKLARYMNPDPDAPYSAARSLYQVEKHHRLIADAFTEVLEGRCLRLALSIPPQFGKSTLARIFLATHAAKYPYRHTITGCYNQTFADEYGEDLRAIITDEKYQRAYPHVQLRSGSKAKDHMVLTAGGKAAFMGIGGSGTGRPADGFLIDDLLKNGKDAESKAIRDDCWNFFTKVANTRCHALSWQVIIMTRWSDDDIIARLTDPKNPYYNADVAANWKVINVPAVIDTEEMAQAMGMKVGDALWPTRFPLEHLEVARKMNPSGFEALYMGRPTPPEGSFYKQADITTYDSVRQFPKNCRMYMTGDLAVSTASTADRSCVGLWGLDHDDCLWLHPTLYWEKKSSDESVDTIIEHGKRFDIMEAWFEKGQLDKAIGPFLEKRMQEEKAYFSLSRLPVIGNKGQRSLSVRGRMRQGMVKFPSFAPWWPAAKEELLKFTGTGNDRSDDFCDMVALIGQALGGQIAANGEKAKVIDLASKTGTMAWVTRNHREQRQQEKYRRALRGM